MSVVYTSVNGILLDENRGGEVTTFVHDTLGNVIETRDASGAVTSETSYWPYGEIASSSGTNPSPWGFCGTLGYYTDAQNQLYVRARILKTNLSRWMTTDSLWPREFPYVYSLSSPATFVDPEGLQVAECAIAGTAVCPGAGTVIGAIAGIVIVGLTIVLVNRRPSPVYRCKSTPQWRTQQRPPRYPNCKNFLDGCRGTYPGPPWRKEEWSRTCNDCFAICTREGLATLYKQTKCLFWLRNGVTGT